LVWRGDAKNVEQNFYADPIDVREERAKSSYNKYGFGREYEKPKAHTLDTYKNRDVRGAVKANAFTLMNDKIRLSEPETSIVILWPESRYGLGFFFFNKDLLP